jgi:hypothetical protein
VPPVVVVASSTAATNAGGVSGRSRSDGTNLI